MGLIFKIFLNNFLYILNKTGPVAFVPALGPHIGNNILTDRHLFNHYEVLDVVSTVLKLLLAYLKLLMLLIIFIFQVLARRCFLRYIYDQITQFKHTGTSNIIISNENNQFEINPKIQCHFYTSHVPCGDASIIPKFESESRKRKRNDSNNERLKQTKIECAQYDKQSMYQRL